jgi:hypothetical protein
MTSARIDIGKAKNTQEAANTLIALKLKLEKAIDAFMHTSVEPNCRYIVNILLNDNSESFIIQNDELSTLNDKFAESLARFGVDTENNDLSAFKELFIAEPLKNGQHNVIGTLCWALENKMLNNSLVLEDRIICYDDESSYVKLQDGVTVVITRLELTDAEISDFRHKQMQEAMNNLKKIGYSVDYEGVFAIT